MDMERKRLVIEVAFAMESYNVRSFLHSDTREIIQLPISNWIEDEWCRKTMHKIEKNPGSYIEIDPLVSQDAFELMMDFARQVRDHKLKNKLMDALGRNRPFYNFKNILYDYPEILQDWHIEKYTFYYNKAEEWLLENRILKTQGL
jgi:hypothetical protein